MGNERIGFSFLQDPRNVCLQGLNSWLVRRVIEVPRLRHLWFRSSQELLFRTDAIEVYVEKVEVFRQLLLIAIYLLGGQPARTTEVLSLRYINTSYGGIRNIFIQHKMVCLLFLYHKGYNHSGQVKVVHRYLPRELGDLLVRYLAVVLPFCQQIQLGQGSDWELSPFIWDKCLVRRTTSPTEDDCKAKLWSSDKMRRILQEEAVRHLGTELNISSWRHIAISIR